VSGYKSKKRAALQGIVALEKAARILQMYRIADAAAVESYQGTPFLFRRATT
jgi:hypothetical protein